MVLSPRCVIIMMIMVYWLLSELDLRQALVLDAGNNSEQISGIAHATIAIANCGAMKVKDKDV